MREYNEIEHSDRGEEKPERCRAAALRDAAVGGGGKRQLRARVVEARDEEGAVGPRAVERCEQRAPRHAARRLHERVPDVRVEEREAALREVNAVDVEH